MYLLTNLWIRMFHAQYLYCYSRSKLFGQKQWRPIWCCGCAREVLQNKWGKFKRFVAHSTHILKCCRVAQIEARLNEEKLAFARWGIFFNSSEFSIWANFHKSLALRIHWFNRLLAVQFPKRGILNKDMSCTQWKLQDWNWLQDSSITNACQGLSFPKASIYWISHLKDCFLLVTFTTGPCISAKMLMSWLPMVLI